jgi:paraquat-inducible protein B
MKRKASATLIGSFVVVGLALIATTIIALAGNT